MKVTIVDGFEPVAPGRRRPGWGTRADEPRPGQDGGPVTVAEPDYEALLALGSATSEQMAALRAVNGESQWQTVKHLHGVEQVPLAGAKAIAGAPTRVGA